MSDMFDVEDQLEFFTGQAPLFPLPNVVQFPHTWLPLHIFEPRYRAMITDALNDDRLIAMALMRPHQESVYGTKLAKIHPVVCLGHIEVAERLPDGRFNLALRGLCRARIESELDTELPYRLANLTLLPDWYPTELTIDRRHRQRELLAGATEVLPELQSAPLLHQLFDAELPLGVLCDVLAHSLGLNPNEAQSLLAEQDVDVRSDLVLQHLRQRQRQLAAGITENSLPAFSLN
ncbi:MAG: LON peptidase substrate-binding domain-containing protein [Planctomycetaceae bacterium]